MLKMDEVADSVGLSVPQARRRIKALGELMDDHIKRGDNNEVLVDDSGLELLRRLEEKRQEGTTIDRAVREIRRELDDGGQQEASRVDSEAVETMTRTMREQIKILREQLDRKDREIERLHDKMDRFLPKGNGSEGGQGKGERGQEKPPRETGTTLLDRIARFLRR